MGYLKPSEFEKGMSDLALGFSDLCLKTPFPNDTNSAGIGPTTYSFMTIGKGGGVNRPNLLFVGGMHAREWAQPDALMSFSEKLIQAYDKNEAFEIPAYTDPKTGDTFGPVTVDKAKVKRIIEEITLIIVPLANPDGRAFTQSSRANKGWRKNRAPRAVASDPKSIGVDLNRNFDIAWDYDIYYDPAFVKTKKLSASKDPTAFNFIGKAPESQPETKNLVWLLDNRPVTHCVDLHSFLKLIMFPWGIEQNGDDDTMTFQKTGWDKKRDGHLLPDYKEFFPDSAPQRLLNRHSVLAQAMENNIKLATGRSYTVGPIATTIYPATGSLTDYCFSKQFRGAGSKPILNFAIEFGDEDDNFQPDRTKPDGYDKIEREVHAAVVALIQSALP
jgi:hypothetical protein